ncbi:MAG: UDP-N-acetylmuramoyl-L-alanine--D-glutamate ligase [Coriobacteriia bacterium]|nr:UDP-N-acetylmuramoyl-L-alanine--D-glutamate ligase [Coriobacteriia bacterium]
MSKSETIEFDPTKKHAPAKLGRVLVLGLGKSGKAVSEYCSDLIGSRVESLTVAAGVANPAVSEFASEIEAKGARVLFDTFDFEESYDVAIASPGISEFSDFYLAAAAHAAEVISEVEFAWRESAKDSRWLAVTGTNGKTTTTALAAHLLKECGLKASAVGNIGDTCIAAVAAGKTDCYVAEVSSYQLASTRDFCPDVAILLNITPDHVKWHRSLENYALAKKKIYANLAKGGTAVVMDATNDVVRGFVRELKATPDSERGFAYIPMGTADGIHSSMREKCGSANAAYLSATDELVAEWNGVKTTLVAASKLQIAGEHNASNALAAAAAALALGADPEKVNKGLTSFAPLEHRIEPCGTVAGIRFYNDSKATNVDATLKALAAFGAERPIVLLGGDDKGTDLSELVAESEAHCKAVVCFGDAGARFLAAFEDSKLPHYSAGKMEDALDAGIAHASAGDIVVLSPACASFDEFSGFEERGRVFKGMVAERARRQGA